MKLSHSRVHFIGIGGIGMCGLAELLHNMGAQVSGSDLSENAQVLNLKGMGILVHIGHDKNLITSDLDVVVYSSAVKPDNIEFQQAQKLKIPLIARAEALAEIMRLQRGIAVAGTHGKTTTTSLTASIFLNSDFDPTIVVGGRLDLIKSTAKLGQGKWLIAEADESDGSFTRLSPEIVIITNIDNDHLDHYKSFENLKKAFYEFASRIPFYGALVICGDAPMIKDLFRHFPKKITYYGMDENNDYFLKNENGNYKIYKNEMGERQFMGSFSPALPGQHNALNALAGILASFEAGITIAQAIRGVEAFQGVDRRFQHKGQVKDVDFYDDYGHHPTEVLAVLGAFKERFPDRRLVILFQPHRYSRTQDCWNDFLTCFKAADLLYILDIYPAGEDPIEGISAQKLCESVDHQDCHYISWEEAEKKLSQDLQAKDIFLTLGAGHVYRLGDAIKGGF